MSRKKYIVHIMGGLGNQLFQYAYGRSLSVKYGADLFLDDSFFADYEWHDYSLKPFQLQAAIASAADCAALKQQPRGLLFRAGKKLGMCQDRFVEEAGLLYNEAYRSVRPSAYVSGYWQSEKYFAHIADLIRQDLRIVIPPSAANAAMLQQIQASNAVALHIRRGNFVHVPEVNKVHGTCSPEYYAAAIAYITERVADPVFYIFSDDLAWAKAHLNMQYPTVFVDLNDAAHDYEDLRLMQQCRHQITANSTFSWWGAWLNTNPNKIVVAPKQWFADPVKNEQTKDLVPESWVRL